MSEEIYSNPEAEDRAIGCALQFPETLDDFIKLKPPDFFLEKNQKIHQSILETYQSGTTPTVMSLRQLFQKKKLDIPTSDLIKKQNMAISSADMTPLIKTLKECTQRRAIKRVGNYFAEQSANPTLSPKELIAKASEFIESTSTTHQDPEPLHKVMQSRLNAYMNNEIKQGVSTGLKEVDDIWAGFFNGELTVLAARPSMGKTALCQHMAKQFKDPVLIFSLEMKKEYLADRFLASDLDVDLDDLRRGIVKKDKLQGVQLSQYPIFVDDTPDTTTFEILGQSRKLKRKHGLGLIIVDFLTLLNDEREQGDSEHQKINKITRKLRQVAGALDVPLLVLAQLSRAVEKRDNKRPTMIDLRESGGIEEAADNILTLYRDEYYNKDTEHKSVVEVGIIKQKQGPRGSIAKVYFDATRGKFSNLSYFSEPELKGEITGYAWDT